MIDPYPHPLQMKVVKCHVYVWKRSGIHSMWVWSLFNQCIMASLSTKQWPRISANFPNLDNQVWWQRLDDGSISPSTAYEGCQTPCICMEGMWEPCPCGFGASTNRKCMEKKWDPFHVGLEPLQPMHNGFIQHQAVTQDFSQLPKSGQSSVVAAA